jgi:hypothetical protein
MPPGARPGGDPFNRVKKISPCKGKPGSAKRAVSGFVRLIRAPIMPATTNPGPLAL